MLSLLVILFIALLLEAIGIVFLSKGLKEIGEIDVKKFSQLGVVIKAGATNPNVLLGIFFEALFFGGFLTLLSRADVTFIWPLTSLGFVITTATARFFLN